jgi:hypothetical protein
VNGNLLGRLARKNKAPKMVAKVAAATGTGNAEAWATLVKIQSLANEVGGVTRRRPLLEALSE